MSRLLARLCNRRTAAVSGLIWAISGFGIFVAPVAAAASSDGVWVVSSSISDRSEDISQFAVIECDAFLLGEFRVTGRNIASEGTHPVVGKIKLSGTLDADGKIKSMGNRRASVWVRGRFSGNSARGQWGETNFGCGGEWTAKRAK